ncbi:uncharacterized protein [Lolium perenne]|uniref:uncharacterized protein n=1 Tax=Lolium perenne TaxID=4522 RepID=UPI003A993C3D
MSRCVWALVDDHITEHMQQTEEGCARKWLAQMMETLPHEEQITVFVTLWAIWHARRKAIHEQIFQSPLFVHHFVQNYLKDLELSKRTVQQPAAATETIAPRWIPPPTGMVKINVDAAVGKNLKRGSVAAIARSSDGVFLGASALIYPGVTEAETLEALACREACDLARDIYASRVRVASDCKMVVQNLEQGTRGVYSHIITEIIEARQSFAFLEFKFESRKSNNEAHKLARSALCDVSGRRVWLDAPPEGMCIPLVID